MTEEEIGRFLSDGLAPADLRRVLRHLMGRCPSCRARLNRSGLGRATAPEVIPPSDASYSAAIRRSLEKALTESPHWQTEWHRVARIVSATERQKQGTENLLAILGEELNGWPHVETLIELSQEARFREPGEMLHLALAAVVAAHKLDQPSFRPGILADLQGRAWSELGNAYRVNEDFQSAEGAFTKADELLQEGTGDPLPLAKQLDFQASLRTAQRRLPEATELLDRVYDIYEQIGECHLAGRALISKGITTLHAGKPLLAIGLLQQGIAMLEPHRDPQLLSVAQHSMLDALVEAGDFREARRFLLQSGLKHTEASAPILFLRLRWVEAKIHRGLGKLWRAETLFQEIREEFLRRSLTYDAALVGLDLMDVWLRQDRTAPVRQLAAQVLQTFEEMAVASEALRAIRILDEACRLQEASAALVQRVVQFLRRLEWEPRLQFAT